MQTTSEMLQLSKQQQVPEIDTSIPTSPLDSQGMSDLNAVESVNENHSKLPSDPSPINKLNNSEELSMTNTTIQQIKAQPTLQAQSSKLLIISL